ncbi:YhjD/YihY/BrkB family envelope integrity protein [Sphingobacterium daejeonense]|uniref:YhjD/YihY/BrkB family envelope integrity protein n=1 Tax=Sphingobacterium daejeonense TaxID=371142 RepID=UPI002938D387|nr:YhjD/YihY/BrkB family envelope integrity protein [Sphingobacterium daejeonense]
MFMDGINFLLTFGITFILFAVIFKVLPDVNINWRPVKAGALFTAILFAIGRFGIGFLSSIFRHRKYIWSGSIHSFDSFMGLLYSCNIISRGYLY